MTEKAGFDSKSVKSDTFYDITKHQSLSNSCKILIIIKSTSAVNTVYNEYFILCTLQMITENGIARIVTDLEPVKI